MVNNNEYINNRVPRTSGDARNFHLRGAVQKFWRTPVGSRGKAPVEDPEDVVLQKLKQLADIVYRF